MVRITMMLARIPVIKFRKGGLAPHSGSAPAPAAAAAAPAAASGGCPVRPYSL